MLEAEKKSKVAFFTSLILEELPPGRAESFLARLHAQLPKEAGDVNEVLNEVHIRIRSAVRCQEQNLLTP